MQFILLIILAVICFITVFYSKSKGGIYIFGGMLFIGVIFFWFLTFGPRNIVNGLADQGLGFMYALIGMNAFLFIIGGVGILSVCTRSLIQNWRQPRKCLLPGVGVLVICLILFSTMMMRSPRVKTWEISLDSLGTSQDSTIGDYKTKWGEIYVTLVDLYGDGHIFRVVHEGVSTKEALKIIAAKKAELQTKGLNK